MSSWSTSASSSQTILYCRPLHDFMESTVQSWTSRSFKQSYSYCWSRVQLGNFSVLLVIRSIYCRCSLICWKLIAAVYDSSCRPNTRHNLVFLILVVQQTIVCLPGLGTDGNMYCLELASTQLVSNAKSYFHLMRTATCRTFLRVYTPTMYTPVISLWRKKSLARKCPRPAHKL
jgi:hypothetical protein